MNNINFETSSDFEIIDLGIQDITVYDIEVDDTHNFFGNNILVHNSVYFEVASIVKKRWADITDPKEITDLIDKFADEEAGPYIDQCYQELSDYLNCDVNLMDMKREAIAESFIIRAKKNYIMKVLDNEGIRYADPYYKMMGIEAIRTSHPIMVREALEDLMKIIIDGSSDELRAYVCKFKIDYMNAPLNKIASPRGITDINKYMNSDYTRKTGLTIPGHVTASINYNMLINKYKLANKFEFIKNGAKIKYLPLKQPNPIKSHIIGFIDDIPSEFGLDEYIDKEEHFIKTFVKPLESFMIYNGWTLSENTLLDMFVIGQIDTITRAVNNTKTVKHKVVAETTSLF